MFGRPQGGCNQKHVCLTENLFKKKIIKGENWFNLLKINLNLI